MSSFKQISVDQLSRLIGTPKCPIIIDVSIDEDFNLDPYLIPSARRFSHKKITDLVTELQDKKVIVICQKGLKLSLCAEVILRGTMNFIGGHAMPVVKRTVIHEPIRR
jgi:rhodanese-related sulfurtransferase